MRSFKGITFNQTRVILDDTEFADCKITECEAIAHTTEPGWKARMRRFTSNTELRHFRRWPVGASLLCFVLAAGGRERNAGRSSSVWDTERNRGHAS